MCWDKHQAWNKSSWLKRSRAFLAGHVTPLSPAGSLSLVFSLVVEIPWQGRVEDGHLQWATKEPDGYLGFEKQKGICPCWLEFPGDWMLWRS